MVEVSEYLSLSATVITVDENGLHRWSFIVSTYSKEEERYQLEAIVKHAVNCRALVMLRHGKRTELNLCFAPACCLLELH